MATGADERPSRGRIWQEVLVTLLMVAAALGTSWSSYQATRWNGEQAKAAARTSAILIDAGRAQGLGEAQSQVDVATFIAWVDADRRGEAALADFYVDRFRAEFRPAFNAWIATRPFTNPEAPATPFAMNQYQLASRQEAERLDLAADASAAEVRRNLQTASNYVLTVVLYAVVLFFAGMSTKITSHRLRWILAGIGCLVLVTAIAWIATFPVSVDI
jgi:hypothetical protein